ncbi:hypothetical protein [Flavobacterium cerinum]|uniref:N-acetyltransferase domain-containing protein n=1 Tax=Flavobacterium cerinum TaxID=2502784 RepID=A0ABY5IVP2_9FLAO|nr:hypothetical protein [Flavobacterium cerinum]UUC46888.1 hypothetical protein NOX80_06735 [Flavobacterium cerinum]
MEYKIRDCKPADLDVLVVLCGKHADYEKADYKAEGKKEQLHTALFSENRMLYGIVAEVEDTIIGYATYTFDFSTWMPKNLFIWIACISKRDIVILVSERHCWKK